jgi:S1-C subfamily serine protease
MVQRILLICCLVLLTVSPCRSESPADAETLYDRFSDRLFQIRLVEKTSGETFSTGSGFQVSGQGHIATNYHVVASLIHKPDTYRLECVDRNGVHRPMVLMNIDIINDLALVLCSDIQMKYFELSENRLSKGAKLFAMGNPYDLSMAIVEGNYNGLLEDRLYERIFFSGALNPGMSGGPAIDRRGLVVGINVSTRGNEIGFLVPVRYLVYLLEMVQSTTEPVTDFNRRIEQQLLDNQEHFMNDVLSAQWESVPYGDARIPKIKKAYIKGWGEKVDSRNKMYRRSFGGYTIPSGVFVSRGIRTGKLSVRYNWLHTDQLNSTQFYNKVQKIFNAYSSPNNATGNDRTRYLKRTTFLRHAGMDWKLSIGIRKYIQYASLFDYTLNIASLNRSDRAIVVSAALAGVTKQNGNAFIKKFIENLQWQH